MTLNHEAVERVSRDIFNFVGQKAEEYTLSGDQEALAALAPVMVTTGAMSLCQTLGPESAIAILNGLALKIEQGDFAGLTAPGPDYRQTRQ